MNLLIIARSALFYLGSPVTCLKCIFSLHLQNENIFIMKSIYSIIITLLLLAACTGGGSVLDGVEAVIEDNPDSAQQLLNQIDNPFMLSDRNHARYALLRTWADDLQDKGIGSDTIIRYAYNYFDEESKHGDTSDSTLLSGFARSCYFMARFYASVDSTKQSETYYRKAIDCAEKCKDFRTAYLAYDYLSYHVVWSDFKEGLELSLKALDTYNKYKKKKVENEIAIRGNVATNYALCGDSANAVKQLRIITLLAKQTNNAKNLSEVNRIMSLTHLYLGDNEKALIYARKGQSPVPFEKEFKTKLLLATCFLNCDSISSAKKLLSELSNNNDVDNRYAVYWQLYKIAQMQNDYSNAFSYADSTYALGEQRLLEYAKTKLNYYQDVCDKESRIEQLHTKYIQKNFILINVLIILAFSVVACFMYWRYRSKNERLKHLQSLIKNKHEQELFIQKEKEQTRLLSSQAKNIELQKEIIRQKAVSIALMQMHVSDKLKEIQQNLSCDTHINMSDKDWQSIEDLLNDTGNKFVSNLRITYPQMKETDIQLCMLAKLKSKNSVIANIFGIGESAVKKRKAQIKKDVFRNYDPKISLEDIIETL